jgi:hypothetical protein
MSSTGSAYWWGQRRSVLANKSVYTFKVLAHLAEGSGKDDDLENLAHLTHEFIDARPLDDVHIVHGTLNLDRDDKVGILDHLQNAVTRVSMRF